MVFKLVQIDSESPIKTKLEFGTHIFGRGKFLNVNDKRISRRHGQFEVTNDSLVITALHQNPCFYQRKEMSQVEILDQNSSVTLNSGDRVGLLPKSFWYEVMHCMESEQNDETKEECQKNTTVNNFDDKTDNEEDTEDSNAIVASENKNLDSTAIQNMADNSKHSAVFDSKDEQMSLLLSLPLHNQEEKSNESESPEAFSPHQKRPHSVSEDRQCEEPLKKIKTDSEDKPDVNIHSDNEAGSNSDDQADVKPPPAAPAAPQRERCIYGASCYRRNPFHRAQLSHPQDADWGAGDRAPCPWGAACFKRDPRHWLVHCHPPGKDTPPPPRAASVVHRQGNVFYINAARVNFYDDHFTAEDSDGNSVDYKI